MITSVFFSICSTDLIIILLLSRLKFFSHEINPIYLYIFFLGKINERNITFMNPYINSLNNPLFEVYIFFKSSFIEFSIII